MASASKSVTELESEIHQDDDSIDNSTDDPADDTKDKCLNEKCIKINQKYELLIVERDELSKNLKEITIELDEAKEEKERMSNDKLLQEQLQTTILNLTSKIQTLQQKLTDTETHCRKLLKEKEDLEKILGKKDKQLCRVHDQHKALLLQMSKDMADLKIGMEKKATEITTELKELKTQYATRKGEIADLKVGTEQRATKIEMELKEIKTEMTQEIKNLRKDLGKEKNEPPKVTMKCEQASSPHDLTQLSEAVSVSETFTLLEPIKDKFDDSGSIITGVTPSNGNDNN